MPAKRGERASSRRHIWLYDEDWEFLQQQHGPGGKSEIGTSQACREIIHIYVTRLRERANQLQSVEPPR